MLLISIDGYTINDIIYKWGTTSVAVGNNEMAQFEYISNNLTSGVDEFSVGKLTLRCINFKQIQRKACVRKPLLQHSYA